MIATTKRLVATPLSRPDLDALIAMHRDPAVMATLGGVRPPDMTRKYLAKNVAHWTRRGVGLWIFRERTTGRFVGRGGLRHIELEGVPEVEIAYALLPEYWGRGLATEIARLSVDVAFRRFNMRDLVAFTLPTNTGSRRVMEKLGFRYQRDVVWHGVGNVLYRRERA
jgi:[ribosomal protein S5]-alanine N-acetyltransferase